MEVKYNLNKQNSDKDLGKYKIKVHPAKADEDNRNQESKINNESTIGEENPC